MKKAAVILLLIFLIAGLSCTDNPTRPQKARFQLFIQDASAPFDSIFISILEIAIRPNAHYQDSLSGWNILYNVPTSFDLAKLRNGRREQLVDQDISTGSYNVMRIKFGGCHAVRNDSLYSLDFPNASNSIVIDSGYVRVTSGKTTTALVDINLYSTISYNHDSSYYFNPRFEFIDIDSSGGMDGFIIPSADIYLVQDSDTLAMTSTEPDNYFGFFGLPEGYYSIFIFPDDTNYRDWEVVDIPVHADTSFDLGTIELPPR